MFIFRNFLLVCLLLFPLIAQSQYAETIRTGRPGASVGPFVLGSKVLQVQSGVNFGDASNRNTNIDNFHLSSVIRYGLSERVEMSAVLAYSEVKTSYEGSYGEENKLNGLSAAQFGLRVNLIDGKGTKTSLGIQSRVKINALSDDFHQDKPATSTIIMVNQPLGGNVGLTANIGLNTHGSDYRDPDGIFILNLGLPLTPRVSTFLEGSAIIGSGEELFTLFDTGLAYLVNPDLQLDFSVGYGRNEDLEDLFFDFGFSWRTHWRD